MTTTRRLLQLLAAAILSLPLLFLLLLAQRGGHRDPSSLSPLSRLDFTAFTAATSARAVVPLAVFVDITHMRGGGKDKGGGDFLSEGVASCRVDRLRAITESTAENNIHVWLMHTDGHPPPRAVRDLAGPSVFVRKYRSRSQGFLSGGAGSDPLTTTTSLLLRQFAARSSDYNYAWIIHHDALYSGDWSVFFQAQGQAGDADILAKIETLSSDWVGAIGCQVKNRPCSLDGGSSKRYKRVVPYLFRVSHRIAARWIKLLDINLLHGAFEATAAPLCHAHNDCHMADMSLRSGSRFLTATDAGVFLGQPDSSPVYSLDGLLSFEAVSRSLDAANGGGDGRSGNGHRGNGKTAADSTDDPSEKRFLHDANAVPRYRLFYPVKCKADTNSGALALSLLQDQRGRQRRIISDWTAGDDVSAHKADADRVAGRDPIALSNRQASPNNGVVDETEVAKEDAAELGNQQRDSDIAAATDISVSFWASLSLATSLAHSLPSFSTSGSTAEGAAASRDANTLPVYWINLDASQNRRSRMETMLNELSGAQQHLRHTRIPATTTAEITEMVEETGTLTVNSKIIDKCTLYLDGKANCYAHHRINEYKRVEFAVTLSHLRAVAAAYAQGDQVALILEDDMIMEPDFLASWKDYAQLAPPSWQVLQLMTNNIQVMTQLAEIKQSGFVQWMPDHYATGAYLINRAGMRSLLGATTNSMQHGWHFPRRGVVVADELVYLFTESYTATYPYFRPFAYESTVQSEKKTAVSKSENIETLATQRRMFPPPPPPPPFEVGDGKTDKPAASPANKILVVTTVKLTAGDAIAARKSVASIMQNVLDLARWRHAVQWEVFLISTSPEDDTPYKDSGTFKASWVATLRDILDKADAAAAAVSVASHPSLSSPLVARPFVVKWSIRHTEGRFSKYSYVSEVVSKMAKFEYMILTDADMLFVGFPWAEFFERAADAASPITGTIRQATRESVLINALGGRRQWFQVFDASWWKSHRFASNAKIKFAAADFIEQYFVLFQGSFAAWFFGRILDPTLSAFSTSSWGPDEVWCGAANEWLEEHSKAPAVRLRSSGGVEQQQQQQQQQQQLPQQPAALSLRPHACTIVMLTMNHLDTRTIAKRGSPVDQQEHVKFVSRFPTWMAFSKMFRCAFGGQRRIRPIPRLAMHLHAGTRGGGADRRIERGAHFGADHLTLPRAQVETVWDALPATGGNLLIWGLGYDSNYWFREFVSRYGAVAGKHQRTKKTINSAGPRIAFIEDGRLPLHAGSMFRKGCSTFDVMSEMYPEMEIYTVRYFLKKMGGAKATMAEIAGVVAQERLNVRRGWDSWAAAASTNAWFDQNLNTWSDLPASVTNERWDVVLILDADGTAPSAVYTTSKLANNGAGLGSAAMLSSPFSSPPSDMHVFVNGYEKENMRAVTERIYFGNAPKGVVKDSLKTWWGTTVGSQAHFTLQRRGNVAEQGGNGLAAAAGGAGRGVGGKDVRETQYSFDWVAKTLRSRIGTEDNAKVLFAKLDTDGNACIDRTEFFRLVHVAVKQPRAPSDAVIGGLWRWLVEGGGERRGGYGDEGDAEAGACAQQGRFIGWFVAPIDEADQLR